jgi:hypothetical protein
MSPRAPLRRRVISALSIMSLIAGWMVVTAATVPVAASAACATATTHSISGIVMGQDHRDINAQISFDVVDRYGRDLAPGGCRRGGYYKSIFMNPTLSSRGYARNAMHPQKWTLSGLPSNAAGVWIELWTRTNTGAKACPTCAGKLDTSRYGFVNRRNVRIGSRNVRLVAPLNCGVSGGTSAQIQGWIRTAAGTAVHATSIHAWSELTPDGSLPLQGWGQGREAANGSYKIDNLAAGQRYAVWISAGGRTYKRVHVAVRACRASLVSIHVS